MVQRMIQDEFVDGESGFGAIEIRFGDNIP